MSTPTLLGTYPGAEYVILKLDGSGIFTLFHTHHFGYPFEIFLCRFSTPLLMIIYSSGWKLHPSVLPCKAVHFKSTILFSAHVPCQDYSLVHHKSSIIVKRPELWRFTITQRGCKVSWTAENKSSWWDKFFKLANSIPLLTSWHVFCNWLSYFESDPDSLLDENFSRV